MRRWGLVTFSLFYVSLAFAQVPLPERRPGERPPLPDFRDPAPAPFVLPPAPLAPTPRLAPSVRIPVSRFRVSGATAFPPAELEALVARYAGRVIGNEELEEARLAITRHYVAAGYINSGAVIPDQELRDGVVEIEVREGRLSDMAVTGRHGFRPGFIEDRVALAARAPLNVNRLQEGIQLLLQNPQFERISAELGAGTRPGESVLRMEVTEAPPGSYSFSFANNRSPAVGGERLEAEGGYRNLWGLGETATLRFGRASGLEELTAIVSVPITSRDTVLGIKLESTETTIVEPPFNLIDIQNRSEYVEIGVGHPVYRTLARRLDLVAMVTRESNDSTVLQGVPFPFSPGLDSGRSVVSALRFVADWTDRTAERVFAARATVAQGIDALGATVLPDALPDSRFAAFLAQLQLAQRVSSANDQILLRGDWQHANGALLAPEKFALGGMQSVRGYRENALVRDNAWALSAEYRRPLGGTAFEWALFADYGEARDDRGPWGKLGAVGAGVRWQPWPGVLAQLYKGFPLKELEDKGDDIQDKGWHFSLAVQGRF
jgi:hemolysin activation/secretion protein